MAKTVRMSDIAEKVGVSVVTVSKALSGQKGVSSEMRERITLLAQEMGYQSPGEMQSGQKVQSGQSYNIGVLVSEGYIIKYDTFYWQLYQYLTKEAARKDSFLMLELLSADAEKECGEVKLLKENKVEGLIVLGKLNSAYLAYLQREAGVPLLFMDFYDAKIQEDCVISDSFYGTYYLTEYLFELGHRDIAFVGTVQATGSIMDRFLGFQKAMLEHGRQVQPGDVLEDRDESRRCRERIALPEHMPTAFVCNSDETAGKVIRSIQEMGLRVPEDVSVVGYDDYLYPGLCDVPLTTHAVDMVQMAREGIKLLLKKIKRENYTKGIHMVQGRLIKRESAAPFVEK